jgi:hypothetical protein
VAEDKAKKAKAKAVSAMAKREAEMKKHMEALSKY